MLQAVLPAVLKPIPETGGALVSESGQHAGPRKPCNAERRPSLRGRKERSQAPDPVFCETKPGCNSQSRMWASCAGEGARPTSGEGLNLLDALRTITQQRSDLKKQTQFNSRNAADRKPIWFHDEAHRAGLRLERYRSG